MYAFSTNALPCQEKRTVLQCTRKQVYYNSMISIKDSSIKDFRLHYVRIFTSYWPDIILQGLTNSRSCSMRHMMAKCWATLHHNVAKCWATLLHNVAKCWTTLLHNVVKCLATLLHNAHLQRRN